MALHGLPPVGVFLRELIQYLRKEIKGLKKTTENYE